MTDKERFESLTGIEQDVQIEERTRHAMENYFNWLHNAILASHQIDEEMILRDEVSDEAMEAAA